MQFIELKSGTSVEGDEIPAFRTEEKANEWTYLMAGTHGDEVEGVYVLQKLFEWLKEKEDLKKNFIVIPILNVDGYRAGTRINAHGVDLNRNYACDSWDPTAKEPKYNPGPSALSEPENVFLDKLFKKFPPKLILSFHSWKPILNFNGDCEEVANFLARYNNYPILKEDIGYPTPGSLGEYGPQKYNSPVLTFECPVLNDDLTLKQIWEENMVGLQALMNSDLI
tara:strand:+ start:60180 stop:60851 length:672 start_codon:yes stop_codon:yes gene_type:complete